MKYCIFVFILSAYCGCMAENPVTFDLGSRPYHKDYKIHLSEGQYGDYYSYYTRNVDIRRVTDRKTTLWEYSTPEEGEEPKQCDIIEFITMQGNPIGAHLIFDPSRNEGLYLMLVNSEWRQTDQESYEALFREVMGEELVKGLDDIAYKSEVTNDPF